MRNHFQILTSLDTDLLSLQEEFNFRLITITWTEPAIRFLFNNLEYLILHKYSEPERESGLRTIGSLVEHVKCSTWNSFCFIPKVFELPHSVIWNFILQGNGFRFTLCFICLIISLFYGSFQNTLVCIALIVWLLYYLYTIETHKWVASVRLTFRVSCL
jgi:hypothetical protein